MGRRRIRSAQRVYRSARDRYLTANTLVVAIKDTSSHMNLNLSRCHYDGAGNMSGAKHGTPTQILKEENGLFIPIVTDTR